MKELKKELNNKQIKKVNGGYDSGIDKNFKVVNKNNRENWFHGLCVDSYEAAADCCTTVRTYDIRVTNSGSSGFECGNTVSVSVNEWDLYEL